MRNFFQKTLLLFFVIIGINNMGIAADDLPTRDKIQDKYKWNLQDIYPSNSDWEKEYSFIESQLPDLANYSGKITNNANELFNFIEKLTKTEARFTKLYIYAALARDTELDNSLFQTNFDKIQKLSSKFSASVSFFGPELLTLPPEKFQQMANDPKLEPYKFKLEVLYRMKEHTLSSEVENVLAQYSVVKSIPNDVYSILNDAEIPFGKVNYDGKEVQVSHGRYRAALYDLNRDYRRDVYKETYVPYNMLKGTMAALYNGRLNTRITDAKIRKYDNPIQAALYPNNIPESVYYNLIETVNKNLKTLHRWADIKKKYLKLDELHPYDSYVTLFPSVQKSYTYDEALELMKKSLAPLGEDYIKNMVHGFENRWIDVYETKNKRSGAYSNSSGSGPHPFILLNWNNTLDDVFTLAHEIGHNMHSFYSEKNQPYHYADYSIFVAEVASTANEALLLDYLIKNATSKDEKMALIEKFLTQAQATFFRQTRFAEFEMLTHQAAMKGEVWTADKLTEEFAKLYQKYWGPSMVTDYEEGLSWARVHHLVKYNFYVYQYSTGFAASNALASQIIKEGKPAIDRYLEFLSAGSSDYPIEILKKAGVDMSTPDPIIKTINKMNEYMDELEKMLNN